MSRPPRSERAGANSKGRPKRRAATNYLYKYQLAGDPNRIEENALKRALQESLEDHTSKPPAAPAAPKQNKTGQGKESNQKARAIINSSTNSSDVSKGSNSSSSTTNSSNDSRDLSTYNGATITKRLRSNVTLPVSSPPLKKRARPTTNGLSDASSSNHKKCDKSDTSVLTGSPIPPFNGAIQRTYSRIQESQRCDVSPRSSTPIVAAKKHISTDNKSSRESSISASTQTSNTKSGVNPTRNTTTEDSAKSIADSARVGNQMNASDDNNKFSTGPMHKQSPPVHNEYNKLKRESKNYAYAKMTALKVNTGKSYYMADYTSMTSTKKAIGILNNSSTNKFSGKISPVGFSRLNAGHSGQALDKGKYLSSNGNKSHSPNNAPKNSQSACVNRTGSRSFHSLPSAAKISITKNNLSATSQGFKASRSFNHTIDLSRSRNQAGVSVTKKRIAQGSWSLLGVPEEKILYIRDDEPPKRLICYPAIKHIEGDVIQVRDSVLLRSGVKQTDLPYIAKVCAFWEDAETGGVMMSLFWYYRPEHTEEGRKPHHLSDEIFASRHRDADSVECIEDKCYVLTFNEYCRYRKRCKMEQVNTTWSLADVTIPVSNESYPRRNRIPDSSVNPELVFCCRQIYDSRNRRLLKNHLINPKYGNL